MPEFKFLLLAMRSRAWRPRERGASAAARSGWEAVEQLNEKNGLGSSFSAMVRSLVRFSELLRIGSPLLP